MNMMRNRLIGLALALAACAIGAGALDARQASSGEQYAGTWAGTYDGAGSGTMELILDKKDGAVAGKVSAATDNGNYTADLKDVTFDGAKMSAKYDFPLDPSAEVLVTANFDGSTAKGTWSLRPKGQADELAGGTLSVSRK
jgi:hypothetical protein